METNREEILADFQACTGIDDVAESILHLETANWNLYDAVNRVLPQEVHTIPGNQMQYPTSSLTAERFAQSEAVIAGAPFPIPSPSNVIQPQPVSASNDIFRLPRTSQRYRMLHFDIKYGDGTMSLDICDNENVGAIKTYLHGELGIPPCRQELRGFHRDVTESTILSSLSLPKDNTLNLIVPDARLFNEQPSTSEEDPADEESKLSYKLLVNDLSNNQEYTLNFPGTKTISEVKQGVYSFTNIPVRYQLWTGWPESVRDDNTLLANCGLDYPVHRLGVQRRETIENRRGTVDISGESSGEEFEDASESLGLEDDMFIHEYPVKRLLPLMPENLSDIDAVSHFITEFNSRYGDNHAMFYSGTLEEAMKEAFQKPAKERKLFAIYLHHDGSVLSNVFCTQLLSADPVATSMTANFITWAWDLTFDSNRQRLLGQIQQQFGNLTATTIRNFNMDQYPILLIVMKIRSTTEVFSNVSLDDLVSRLIQAIEMFTDQQKLEIVEEDERQAREQVKREQDEAYQVSLAADKAKEEIKRLEREEVEAKRLEREQVEAFKLAERKALEQLLPAEPAENADPSTISSIKIRLPNGEAITRRFLANTKLKVLLDYITVQGYPSNDYKVLSSWPRKDLTSVDWSLTLEQLKLCPQETITLEQR
ncbi:hypothetical protein CHUAL_012975 [Chamberlinius hualienensis]